jgi:hypothetical protein
MAKKSKGAVAGAISSVMFLFPKLFNFVGNIGTLVKMEAQQAKRNLTIIVTLMFISVILLTTTWLCLLALAYLYLVTLHLSEITSLLIVTVFNVLLLVFVGMFIFFLKRHLFFPATFAQLSKRKL